MYRTRPWHGCEHKAIAAGIAGDLDNISKYSTINDHCGGTYLFSIYLGLAIWFLITKTMLGFFSLMFLIMYFESKYFHEQNKIGIWIGEKLQILTTKEPTEEMLSMGERGVRALLIRERNHRGDGQ